jgi:very-short-patch-repair endonuclease
MTIQPPNENASSLQKALYQVLVESSVFNRMTIKQEVLVKQLVPEYSSSLHRIDYYIREMCVVVELHGIQHEKPRTFGGMSKENAGVKFASTRNRDSQKQIALEAAGYIYVEIWYDEKLSEKLLLDKIIESSKGEGMHD